MDTVRIAGHNFVFQPGTGTAAAAAQTALGAPVGRVRCRLTDYQIDPAYRSQDGDATFLAVGTTLYAVVGQDPAKVLGVRAADGSVRLYRAPQSAG